MASAPTPTSPKSTPAGEHRLQDATVTPVPRPPVATSADW